MQSLQTLPTEPFKFQPHIADVHILTNRLLQSPTASFCTPLVLDKFVIEGAVMLPQTTPSVSQVPYRESSHGDMAV